MLESKKLSWRICFVALLAIVVAMFIAPIGVMSMTSEREAYLATNPYKGITIRIMAVEGNLAQAVRNRARLWEKETGGKVEVVGVPIGMFHQKIFTDLVTGLGRFDAYMTASWYYGDFFSGKRYIVPLKKFMEDPRFPQWDPETELPAMKKLRTWGGEWYGVPYDNDAQVLYYRKDIFNNPEYRKKFKERYGYELPVPPRTTDQVLDVAEFFNGWDWDKDGKKDYGVTMHLKTGGQGMFHFMSWAAPYVISPENQYFWFNPENMEPIINSPGHVKALEDFKQLVQYGPRAMFGWTLGEAWDLFLAGDAALTFTWGDLGALAQNEKESKVKGKLGVAPMPGRYRSYDPIKGKWIKFDHLNRVGNTTGGSWHGVISILSKHKEATYDFLAFMARKDNIMWNYNHGWTGCDPGRSFAFLPPHGTADLKSYVEAGWNAEDIKQYLGAYWENFSNPLSETYLRIPGTDEYWRALDVAQAKAALGKEEPSKALDELYNTFWDITKRHGTQAQLDLFREAVGYEK